jgi:hypothetical protein
MAVLKAENGDLKRDHEGLRRQLEELSQRFQAQEEKAMAARFKDREELERLRASLILSGVSPTGIGRDLLSPIGSDRVKVFPFESVEGCGGVLHYLRHDVSPFDPRVILSQSHNDVISVINPTRLGLYLSGWRNSRWIGFRFRDPVRVTGMKITGDASSYPPMKFTIHAGPNVVRTVTAEESRPLRNGEIEDFTFPEVTTTELRIEHQEYSWSRDRNVTDEHMNISHRRIEILSPDYPKGVFTTFFEQHAGEDDFDLVLRQFVQVRAQDYDLEELHKPDNRTGVYTHGGSKYAYLQIDFCGHQFVATSYRLHRFTLHPRQVPPGDRGEELHAWSLRGSNDRNTPTDAWTVLHQYRDQEPGAGQGFDVYPAAGGPYRYFRFCVDEPIWKSETWYELQLKHIELYGVLIDAVS